MIQASKKEVTTVLNPQNIFQQQAQLQQYKENLTHAVPAIDLTQPGGFQGQQMPIPVPSQHHSQAHVLQQPQFYQGNGNQYMSGYAGNQPGP